MDNLISNQNSEKREIDVLEFTCKNYSCEHAINTIEQVNEEEIVKCARCEAT